MSARHLLRAAGALTTPLLPDDYLSYVNPLWAIREPRGRVEAVEPETADAATLWIRPGIDFPAEHAPGQYVRVGVDVRGVRHWRTYSVTDRDGARFAITVKAVPDGLVSHQLVHGTRPAAILRLAPFAGDFVLPDPVPRKILFVTAGSGITPVMAMLRSVPLDDVVHVHLAPSAQDVIFADELRALGHAYHEHHDDTHGIWQAEHGLPEDWRERETWACGPAGLLDALAERFEHAGIPERLHVERFRPVLASVEGEGGTVTFTASGVTAEADGSTPLLVAGEQAGALLPNGCRMGICHTCVGRLCSGAVRDLRTGELHDTEGDLVRTCVSAAAGPVEIDL